MKTKLENIALEGTCSGDVAGGLLSWTGGKPSGAFVFCRKGVVMAKAPEIEWGKPYDVREYKNRILKKMRHYSKKLKDPINERTGKPLEDSTLKTYNSQLKEVQREKQRVDNAIKEMKKHGLSYSYRHEEWPNLDLIVRPWNDKEPWTFLGGLVKSKKVVLDDNICISDLKRIIDFIMLRHHDEVENVSDIQSAVYIAIKQNFIRLLDQMINEIRGDNARRATSKGKRSKSNVIDLNISRANR